MPTTLDLVSSVKEERQLRKECLPEVDLSSTLHERTNSSANKLKCLDHWSSVQMEDAERSSCGLVNERRGTEPCSSVQSLSVHTLHYEKSTDGLRCCRSKNERGSRHEQYKDTVLASSLSHDVSQVQPNEPHTLISKLQPGQYHWTHHYSLTSTQDNSKLQNISYNKKPPVFKHLHKNQTFFFSFANFIFASFLLVSLFSPSLSLTTSSASTSPNLNSWSLAALETIDAGMEHKISSHRVPIPDTTAIVGRLFQFQIPSSTFSGEVSRYKAIRAGSRELPKWIHFDENAGLFSGVPLPEDKGQIYISVDGHITASVNGKVSIQTTIFSLNVIQLNFSTNSSTLINKYTLSVEDQVLGCNPQSTMTHFIQCVPNKARVLANILFLVPFDSLTPSEKTQLFINTAKLFDVCPQYLELRNINWTNDEGVWLWSKLATGEIIDTLESATILSFQTGCESFNYFTQSPLMELLAQATDICREGLLLSDDGYIWVNCHQWFITAGTKTFISQMETLQAFDNPLKVNTRTKRQTFDGTDGPVAIPDLGDNNNEGPFSTSSATMSSKIPLKASILSTQAVATSLSESTRSAASLMPSLSVNRSQISTVLQNIQPTPTSSSYNTLRQISESSSETSQPSSLGPIPRESMTSLSSSINEVTSTSIQLQTTPIPTGFSGSGSGSGVDLSLDFSSSVEDLLFVGPTSTGQAESLLIPIPEPSSSIIPGAVSNIFSTSADKQMRIPSSRSLMGRHTIVIPIATPLPSSLPTTSVGSVSSSMAFSSIEPVDLQTQIPFLTMSSSPTDRPFIRVSSSPVQSTTITASSSSSTVDRLLSSSSIDRPIIDLTTAVMMIITPTPSTPRLSFSIASTIEVLTSGVRASPSLESSIEVSPTDTFIFSMATSDMLRPLPFTTSPVIDFTASSDFGDIMTTAVVSSPARTTNILVPLPTSELSLSMSVFTPHSFLPDTSSIFMPIFTSSFVPSSILPVSPTPTRRSDGRLRPMSTSELTLLISMFTPSMLQSSTDTIETTSPIPSFSSLMPTPSRTVSSEISSISSAGETVTSSFIFVVESSESLVFPFSTSMVQLPSSSLAFSSSSILFISPSPTPDVSMCQFINCTNGECIELENDTITCECLPGWTGMFCEIPIIPVPSPSPSMVPTICDIIDCNNGTCIPDEFEMNFTCQCFLGYTGEFCDVPIELSIFVPTPTPSPPVPICGIIDCNNGTCIPDDFEMNFTCQCFLGYTGEFCDVPIELSIFVPTPTPSPPVPICGIIDCNNGTCIPDEFEMNFTCQCFLGYTGEFCDVPIELSIFVPTPTPSPPVPICDIIDCNNGTCIPDMFEINFTCQCFLGYTGEFCDVPIELSIFVPTPTPSPPVLICDIIDCNNGTCIPDEFEMNFTCQCFLGYTGEFCDVPIESSIFVPTPTPSPPVPICDIIDCNNGTCVADDFSDNFTCQCFAEFTGEFCDISLSTSSFIAPTPASSTPFPASSFLFVISSSESLLVPFLTPTTSSITSSSALTFSFSSPEFTLLPSSFPPPSSPIPSITVTISSSLTTVTAPLSLSLTAIPSTISVLVSPTPTVNISMCDFVNCTNGVCIELEGDVVTCECFPGFTGMFCEIPIMASSSFILTISPSPSPPVDICDFIDCNNGSCFAGDFGDNYTCQCFTGYTGQFCDILLPSTSLFITPTPATTSDLGLISTSSIFFFISSSESLLVPFSTFTTSAVPISSVFTSPTPTPPVSLCDFVNCTNGVCLDLGNDTIMCECFAGFTGIFCDVPIAVELTSFTFTVTPTPSPPVSTCDFINCNNGSCLADQFGDNFTCQCFAGYTGEFCDVLLPTSTFTTSIPLSSFIPTVTPSPSPLFNICDFIECNNGTCVADEFGENLTCVCFVGYTGEFCDVPLLVSSSIPPISMSSSIQFLFSSSESLLVPFSSPSPSIISMSVTQISPMTAPTTTATITPTPSPNISLCEFVNCTNGECIDLGDDFIMCKCFPGWTGMFCDVPIESSSFVLSLSLTPTPTPSPSPTGVCDQIDCNNGTCVPDVFGGENFTCQCFVGWTGEFCDIPLPPPSICDLVNCSGNGECIDLGDDFNCSCFPGFTGALCDIPLSLSPSLPSTRFISPTPTLSPSPPMSICDFINCSGNGNCIDLGDDFNCSCFPGFTGALCDIPLSLSPSLPSTSFISPTATPSPISICDFINCSGNGDCIDLGDDFNCSCSPGFTGALCDISLSLSPSLPSTRFISPTATPSPSPPISICDFINCSGNGDCIDLGDDFNCSCSPGFTGALCDIPLSLSPSLPSTRFISPMATPSPSPPISICDFINCSGNGNCIDLGDNFNCSCFPEYTGEICDIPVPPSPTLVSSASTVAISTSAMFTFLVPSSESLLIPLPTPTSFISFSSPIPPPSPSPSPPMNFCDFENCSGNGQCNDLGDDFNCTCYVGWTGSLCETDIDFCQPDIFGSCNQTGTAMCLDGNSTHACECLPGFTGDLCSVDIDDCDPDPCFNNATCADLPFGEFMCECLPGFTGPLCNETFSPCDPNPCKEPEEICTITGFEEGNFVCIIPPTTTSSTTTILPSTTSPSPSLITTSSVSLSIIGQLTSVISLSTSSMLVSTSATPTPTPIPPNTAPVVLNSVGTLLANEGQVTHFIIPELTFYDSESGSTSNLRLSLFDSDANELPNTTWIYVNNGAIQALPLREQAVLDLVTEYTFILRASDEQGALTHDFVTVRVLRQQENFQNYLVVPFEGSFTTFNQSLSDKVALVQRLSSHINGTLSSVSTVFSTPNIYISAFRNGSIAVAYRDISIPDMHCANFRAWVATVYTDSSYSPSFIRFLSPQFVPIAQPVIEGPCNLTDINPTLAATQGLSPVPQSNIILFLATVIPTILVACICLLVGILLFINYRSRRSERKGLKSRAMERIFTHRRPVILDEEWDLPNRRRRPVILPSDYTIANTRALEIANPANNGRRPLLLEELDYGREDESSDEEVMTAPGLSLTRRNRYATMSPDPPVDEGPPPYVLPPLFPT